MPAPVRRHLRDLIRDAPTRLNDLLPDLLDLLRSKPDRLPPARLRGRVGLTSGRQEFSQVGAAAARDIEAALQSVRHEAVYPSQRWLDFGCGSGRITRHFLDGTRRLWGVDVDRSAILWAQTHLREAEFLSIKPCGPVPLPDGFLDVVFANSVFTHFPEDLQILWLKELRRLLRAGGFFIVSTHSPTLTFTRPDLTPDQHATLLNRGFLFAPGNGPFSEDSAFHSRQYMEESWGRHFDLRSFASLGLVAYQDLSVWEKPCSG